MYEMICELPDYITDALGEFVSHYGSLEEVYEHKDDIYFYPDCADMTDIAYYFIDDLICRWSASSNMVSHTYLGLFQ